MIFKQRRRSNNEWIVEGKTLPFGKWRQRGSIFRNPVTGQYQAVKGVGLRRRSALFLSFSEARGWIER